MSTDAKAAETEASKTDADRAATVGEVLAGAAQDRDELLAKLRAADQPPTADTPKRAGKAWRVVRQYNHLPEVEVSQHRFEWVAELCAMRRTAGHATETGVLYTVRRAEA